MKHNFNTSGPWVRAFFVLNLVLIALIAGCLAIFSWSSTPASYAQDEGATAYIPVQMAPVPTPTPGPPPQFIKNVELAHQQCPNDAGFNSVTDLMYIANIYSDSVSVFHDREFVANIFAGEWPREIVSDPNSSRTWVAAMHTGTTLFEGTTPTGMVPRFYEPYSLAFNPVNGYVYITDLNSKVQVIDGAQLVKTIDVTNPETGGSAGWMLPIVVDPNTGLVYAASWEYGRLYVIEGTKVINSVRLGSKPVNMAIDPVRGLIYVAHAGPDSLYPHDISVVDVATLAVTYIDTLPGQFNHAEGVAVEVKSGLAYVTNPDLDSVTILHGARVVGQVSVGEQPWGVGVNPNDGYVFVTNRKSNDVSIFLNGTLMDTVGVQGEEPFAVGVDTNDNDIYIINRGVKVHTSECKKASVTILH